VVSQGGDRISERLPGGVSELLDAIVQTGSGASREAFAFLRSNARNRLENFGQPRALDRRRRVDEDRHRVQSTFAQRTLECGPLTAI
jgi:hypothetical protein